MSQFLTSIIKGYLLDNLILVFGMKNCLFIRVQNIKKCFNFFLPSYEICADFDTNFLKDMYALSNKLQPKIFPSLSLLKVLHLLLPLNDSHFY